MKYKSFNTYIMDDGEPVLRSCWECNDAHWHLKDSASLHLCFVCSRYWIFGRYLDVLVTDEMDIFLRGHLVHVGEGQK